MHAVIEAPAGRRAGGRIRGTALWSAVALLIVSALLHAACYWRWPGNPDWDVHHSVFAAENFVETGKLRSINLYPPWNDDLASHTALVWMSQWPPAHAWLYATAMSAGLSAGASTKLLGFLCIVLGGLGWIRLVRAIGSSHWAALAVAAAYPWVSFIARSYLDYKNDDLACAVAPWICLAVLRIQPLRSLTREQWGPLLAAALVSGLAVTVKYSLAPFVGAGLLYLVWLDGRGVTRERVARLAAFCLFLALPGVVLWMVNRSWPGSTYPLRPGSGLALSVPLLTAHFFSNTFAYPLGWDQVFSHLAGVVGRQAGVHLPQGTVFVAALLLLAIWIRHGWRARPWPTGERRLLAYLLILTAGCWAMLTAMTLMSGLRWDFSSDGRFFMPLGLAWLALWTSVLSRSGRGDLLRSVTFYTLVVPVLFSGIYFAGYGLLARPFAVMPRSQTAWIQTADGEHAAFLSRLIAERGHRPDLLVAPEGRYMTEVGEPCLFTFRALVPGRDTFYSSRNLEVWAMVYPADVPRLLSNFKHAAAVEPVPVPAGFPYAMYIFRFLAARQP